MVRALLRQALVLFACLGTIGCGADGTTSTTAATPTSLPTLRPALGAAPAPSPSPRSAPSASPTVAKDLVYVAIGASDTVGVGADDPATQGWVPRLGQLLGPSTRVRNLGVSGTLLEAALREQLPAALRERPDLVTVWLAVNDINAQVSLQRYSAELNGMLRALNEQTEAVVLIANVPNLVSVPRYSGADAEALREEVLRWNTVIEDSARRNDAVVVDLFGTYGKLAVQAGDVASDGFHPSSAGYARIAEVFYAAAQTALEARQ